MDAPRIGVLCPSEIALRRFMPALAKTERFVFAGVAAASRDEWQGNVPDEVLAVDRKKAESFLSLAGRGEIFAGYGALLDSPDVDCVYIPLPPALHYEWAKKALERGKHVLLEKPFTTEFLHTRELVDKASLGGRALHENYMFRYHSQIEWIREQMRHLGEIRMIRIDFGFPFRGGSDFRYNKKLGGGALLDCGGYTLKLASILLGNTARVVDAALFGKIGLEVDIAGCAAMRNREGLTAQISFGMDNTYRCSLDVWGSKGTLCTNRILTAPDGFTPVVTITGADGAQEHTLPADDSFLKSIERFADAVTDKTARLQAYDEIIAQSGLVQDFLERAL